MPPPSNLTELRSLMGMLNYLGRFLKNLATTLKPISDLLKADVNFKWGIPQKSAFEAIKKKLTQLPSVTFYRADRPTTVTADASSYGLGGAFLQQYDWKLMPVPYCSRTCRNGEVCTN